MRSPDFELLGAMRPLGPWGPGAICPRAPSRWRWTHDISRRIISPFPTSLPPSPCSQPPSFPALFLPISFHFSIFSFLLLPPSHPLSSFTFYTQIWTEQWLGNVCFTRLWDHLLCSPRRGSVVDIRDRCLFALMVLISTEIIAKFSGGNISVSQTSCVDIKYLSVSTGRSSFVLACFRQY